MTASPSRRSLADAPSADAGEIDFNALIVALEALAEDRALLAELGRPLRARLLTAANRVAQPDRTARRKLRKELRRREIAAARDKDERRLQRTGIRVLRSHPTAPVGLPEPTGGTEKGASAATEPDTPPLDEARNCYVCKTDYHQLHPFYDQLCPSCAAFNWEKREQSADLRGRVAMVTGGRVKIGYHTALKLLRAGARVVVTTRFPRDGVHRFAAEPDFEDWRGRLELFGLDLRHLPSVAAFAHFLEQHLPQLDVLIHNACQTVRRPPGFYEHLMAAERAPLGQVDAELRPLLAAQERLESSLRSSGLTGATKEDPTALQPLLPGMSPICRTVTARVAARGSGALRGGVSPGLLDADLQQVDRRTRNSWRLRLHEVSPVELLEVQLINTVAPFILSGRLRALMNRRQDRDRHIVNVSAVEGQFYRAFKTVNHPHTNMAKASLNMMTRTSALDYFEDGIHMNSVDTGWITDEDPVQHADRKRMEMRFHPPLDAVDGAARILDPVFHGYRVGEHWWGRFFKDYRPAHW